MKNSFLTILLLFFAHFLFAQNVKIIPASEKSGAVNKAIIVPAPTPSGMDHSTPAANKKTNSIPAVKTSVQKNEGVKPVRGASEKKPCVQKISPTKKNPSAATKNNLPESSKK